MASRDPSYLERRTIHGYLGADVEWSVERSFWRSISVRPFGFDTYIALARAQRNHSHPYSVTFQAL